MLKIVILSQNLSNAKNLINKCLGKISSLQIIGILNSDTEFDKFKKENYFDILLLNNYDIEELDNLNYQIININNSNKSIKKDENKLDLPTNISFDNLQKNIKQYLSKTLTDSIREKTTAILIDLGFNFKHIGTKYIADAICYCTLNNFDCSLENMEKDIYPYLSKVNNIEIDKIKWSLARTVNLMYLRHTTKSILKLEEYFCLDHLQKPTPKLIISVISNKLLYS